MSGCTQSEETCVVQDYGGATGGYQTPQQALASVLAEHDPLRPQLADLETVPGQPRY